jgi:hypothetical protein
MGTLVSWPRTAPAVNAAVCVSAKNALGSASIRRRENSAPVSAPPAITPVVNGPCMQPTLRSVPSPVSSGLGNARRGGPEAPSAASWMCVAVRAGLW